jgi:hypothetical protein
MNTLNASEVLVNFLHYGNAMEQLAKFNMPHALVLCKDQLINQMESRKPLSKYTKDVIRAFGSEYKKSIDVQDFLSDIRHSKSADRYFKSLNCRGFSYLVTNNFEFDTSFPLRPTINYRLALIAARDLYYPPRLRRYLPRKHGNHIRIDRCPSLAFALGRIKGRALFIFVLQSDLVFKGPACIRDYIRGWRKVLFAEILRNVDERVNKVYLVHSKDLLRTCHPEFFPPMTTPHNWRNIYEGTANDFQMQEINLTQKINIQVFHELPQC